TRGGTGTKFCIYYGTATSGISSDNNVFYINAPAGTNNLGYSGGNRLALLDWQTATSGDSNSVEFDPMFVNSTSAQLIPTNAGVNGIADTSVNVPTDFNGVSRSATPDPGAFEFSPPNCAFPYDLAAFNITANSADLTWTEPGLATEWE